MTRAMTMTELILAVTIVVEAEFEEIKTTEQ